jgi:hypothetical protein
MRERTAELLERRTGQDVEAWNRRLSEHEFDGEASLRAWLGEQGVNGYPQNLLVWERFGYPTFLTADADDLIGGQYADRPARRPIFEAVVAALPAVGEVALQARKTYVSLVSPRRTFAVVQPTTRTRVDLGLRLEKQAALGRLKPAKGVGNGNFNVRVGLESPKDVDDEVLGWLRRAYEENA